MRSARTIRFAAFVAAAALSMAACGDSAPDVFFPTWSPSEGEATATGALEGRLVERGDCLMWDAGADFLPIWPDTYEFDGSAVLADSEFVLDLGESAFLGGGERSLRQAESLMDSQIPQRCHAPGGYWIVTQILSDLGG
jgi:hypothetical protein